MTPNPTQERELRGTDQMVPAPVRIQKILWETEDTFTLFLDTRALDGYSFSPGQFNMLYGFGVGESAISISSHPAKGEQIAHTIHRVGTLTSVLAQLKKDDVIGLRGPFGSTWPVEPAKGKDVCLVAGGIGLAPLRPLIYSLIDNRASFGRIVLLYGARSSRDLLYQVELEQWANRYDVEVLTIVDRGDPGWKGHIGVVTNLFSYIQFDEPRTVAYVCGPETMMKYTILELERKGFGAGQIHLSMERNMKCAIGLCGHCQYGPFFICKDGPVFHLPAVLHLLDRKEL